jgi:hypothetical protein
MMRRKSWGVWFWALGVVWGIGSDGTGLESWGADGRDGEGEGRGIGI